MDGTLTRMAGLYRADVGTACPISGLNLARDALVYAIIQRTPGMATRIAAAPGSGVAAGHPIAAGSLTGPRLANAERLSSRCMDLASENAYRDQLSGRRSMVRLSTAPRLAQLPAALRRGLPLGSLTDCDMIDSSAVEAALVAFARAVSHRARHRPDMTCF